MSPEDLRIGQLTRKRHFFLLHSTSTFQQFLPETRFCLTLMESESLRNRKQKGPFQGFNSTSSAICLLLCSHFMARKYLCRDQCSPRDFEISLPTPSPSQALPLYVTPFILLWYRNPAVCSRSKLLLAASNGAVGRMSFPQFFTAIRLS